jgi:hypothetical protein
LRPYGLNIASILHPDAHNIASILPPYGFNIAPVLRLYGLHIAPILRSAYMATCFMRSLAHSFQALDYLFLWPFLFFLMPLSFLLDFPERRRPLARVSSFPAASFFPCRRECYLKNTLPIENMHMTNTFQTAANSNAGAPIYHKKEERAACEW